METDVDLSLLPLLVELMKTRNMRQVALKFGKSKGAISKSLAKLRDSLGNELFIKSSTGLEPTDYMVSIYPNLESLLRQLELSLQKEDFDPFKYEKRIVIAAASAVIDRFGRRIQQLLSESAPKAQLVFQTWDEQTPANIERNEINAGIHLINPFRAKSLYPIKLVTDSFVVAVRTDHPAKSFIEALNYPIIAYKSKGWNDLRYQLLDEIDNKGIEINRKIDVDDVTLLLNIIKNSDMVGPYIKGLLNDDFRAIKLPDTIEDQVQWGFYIKTAFRHSPLNQWLFSQVQQAMEFETAD